MASGRVLPWKKLFQGEEPKAQVEIGEWVSTLHKRGASVSDTANGEVAPMLVPSIRDAIPTGGTVAEVFEKLNTRVVVKAASPVPFPFVVLSILGS